MEQISVQVSRRSRSVSLGSVSLGHSGWSQGVGRGLFLKPCLHEDDPIKKRLTSVFEKKKKPVHMTTQK